MFNFEFFFFWNKKKSREIRIEQEMAQLSRKAFDASKAPLRFKINARWRCLRLRGGFLRFLVILAEMGCGEGA